MKKPNIIIFNPDQFRAKALGHLGNPASVTPNLDKTVLEDGVSFSSAFCQNPVCTPSRCSFMTGLYPHVHGHRTMYYMLRENDNNLLNTLKDNNYFIWWGGKNDLFDGKTDPLNYCDHLNVTSRKFEGFNIHSDNSWRGDKDGDNYFSFYKGKIDTDPNTGYIDIDTANVLDAIDFIKGYKGDKPLCVYLPLEYPHPPYAIENPFYDLIDINKVRDPIPPYSNWEDKPNILSQIYANQHIQNWDISRLKELKRTYLAMCSKIDNLYGKLVDCLKEKNIYDDTAIFCFSDHGDFTGDYGLVEKTQNTFQDCLTNVPFIIKPPKNIKVKPRVSNALVELIDFSATVYDIANIDPQCTSFGKSLVDVLEGKTDNHRDAVFCEGGRMPYEKHCSEYLLAILHHRQRGKMPYEKHCSEYQSIPEDNNTDFLYAPRIIAQENDTCHSKATMLRTDCYKYVYRVGEKNELYDLAVDPNELTNVIDNEKYANILNGLKDRLLKFTIETADVVPYKADQRFFDIVEKKSN